jgi:hypothetical protein
VVRNGPRGAPHAWTDVRPWANLRWAGERLLATRSPQAAVSQRIIALSGPGRRLVVAAPRSRRYLVAVSPTGTLALLGEQRQRHAGVDRLAVLVLLTDGRVLDRISLAGSGLDALGRDGDWVGDQIVVANGYTRGGPSHPDPEVAVLTETRGHLALRRVYRLILHGEEIGNAGPGYIDRVSMPEPGRIVFQLNSLIPARWVTCRLWTRSCTARTSVGATVDHPSRPAAR